MNTPNLSWIRILAICLAPTVAYAADMSDLGVPKGWPAMDYEKRGHELLNKHQYELARRYLTAAIRVEPDRWSAFYNRALTYYQQKNWTAALQDLNATIRIKPSFFEASLTRARVNEHLHNYRAALRDYDVIHDWAFKVENYSEYAQTLNSRAWIRATCPDASLRNAQLAIGDAKKACKIDEWKYAPSIDTLAAAYAEAGDFESAIRYQEQALRVLQTEPQIARINWAGSLNPNAVERIAADIIDFVHKSAPDYAHRLELYKQHRPYRQPEPPEY